MDNESGLNINRIVKFKNGDRYILTNKIDYKGDTYFFCRKIYSNNTPVSDQFFLNSTSGPLSSKTYLMKENIQGEKVFLIPITGEEFKNQLAMENGLTRLILSLYTNTIITLDNEKRYLITNGTYYKGTKFFMAIGVDNNRNIITTDVLVLREHIDDNSIYVERVTSPDILAEVARFMLPHLAP